MKSAAATILLLGAVRAFGQPNPAPTLKSVLLAQLKSTHDVQEWFVPAVRALDGLTVEQANWKPGPADHSIAQLVHHLTFWDRRQLDRFEGRPAKPYNGNNDETFQPARIASEWNAAVRALDEVMKAWESAVEKGDDDKLRSWYSTIAHIAAHNAYHTGQILYVRKLQGSWDPAKGVK